MEREEDWEARQDRTQAAWGNENTNKKNSLFRVKGLRDDPRTTGRFLTSTKPWLDGYHTVQDNFKKGLTPQSKQL